MKHRAILLIVVLLGICSVMPVAQAGIPAAPTSRPVLNNPLQNLVGKDISGTDWKGMQNPDGLPSSDDSTNSIALKGFSESHLDSLFGTNSSVTAGAIQGGNAKIESAKPIEKVALHEESPKYNAQPTPVVPRRSDTKRIVLIVLACAAILAFRKFRRPHANVPWKKPSFL